jgi:hypothetical protein
MAIKMITPTFRVSYPNVFTPRENKLSGKMEFSVQALFPKGTDLTALEKAIQAVIVEKWPNVAKRAGLKMPLKKQEDRALTDEKTGKEILQPPYERGALYLNLKTDEKNQPQVLDQRKAPIDPVDFYAGCFARASVTVSAYDKNGNKGVSVYLNNLQKVKDGEPLGGRVPAEMEFEAIESADSAEDVMG